MKKALCLTGILFALLLLSSCSLFFGASLPERVPQSIREEAVSTSGSTDAAVPIYTDMAFLHGNPYCAPDYDSTSTVHAGEFLETLKRDGYETADGTVWHDYNTDGELRFVNITPKSVSDETADVELFLNPAADHTFLMVRGKIYRFDSFGGYHYQICLWDYDGNGQRDLVTYFTSGSGISYLNVGIFDLTVCRGINVVTRQLIPSSKSARGFSFEFKDGRVYLDGEELTYADGEFHCAAFAAENN